MKKKIIFGIVALVFTVLNIYQVFQNDNTELTFKHLIGIAYADGESGGEDCFGIPVLSGQLFDCPGSSYQWGERSGTVTCGGTTGTCMSGTFSYVYDCDGTIVGSDNLAVTNC